MDELQTAMHNLAMTGHIPSILFVLERPETTEETVRYVIEHVYPKLAPYSRERNELTHALCANEHTPDDFIRSYMWDAKYVPWTLSKRPRLTEELCAWILNSFPNYSLRDWSNLPPKAAIQVAARVDMYHLEGFIHNTKHPEVLDYILDHKYPNYVIRCAIARHPLTSHAILARLIQDTSSRVRAAVHQAITERGIDVLDLLHDPAS